MMSAQTHMFYPCGHLCVCAECGELVMDAPSPACVLCRQTARECMQVYIA